MAPYARMTPGMVFKSAVYWLGPAARYSIYHFPWTWGEKESWISWN